MVSINGSGKLALTVPDALLRAHDEVRGELVRASLEDGPIAIATKRLAPLCLSHFEYEEKTVFPVLALLPYLEQGDLRPEMMDVLQLIGDFHANRDALRREHQLMVSAIEELRRAAHNEKNREYAEFAYCLRAHERIEEEVIFPAVVLIGKYLLLSKYLQVRLEK